ncbi:MAG TPA: aspartate-semialdehyde dehydrogenase [Anaerolineae bacterium]|nr:aspartate-semialdehyde dehydrogenase [Anaerolineae bacterium]
MDKKIPVGIIGATGAVGQRFISLLADHPWFEITDLLASERSAGQRYGDVVKWILPEPLPARIADLTVRQADAGQADARVLFSALPSSQARTLEPLFASRGHYIFSNASAFRMDEDVPLVITEVNPDHLDMIPIQQARRGWDGFIVCNANCTSTHLIGALHPLHLAFGVKKVFVATLQAASGAGYPGIPSMDLIDNIVPHSYGEEEKVETEPRKIMGDFVDGAFRFAQMTITAHCHRVPVLDGHTEAVSVALGKEATLEDILDAFRSYRRLPQELSLPSAPDPAVVVVEGMHRPQPRLDRMAGRGMATVVGRIRPCNLLDWRFSLLGHNTIRGAAGGSILNAELMAYWGRLG